MLWKKRSDQRNALYVDIFRSLGSENDYNDFYEYVREMESNSTVEKSDDRAFELRMEGNENFRTSVWYKALRSYNDSLLFATDGSEHISLAYANRSAIFLRMKKYNECLIDIKLAREAGYPQHLMPKLDKRETDCLKQMEEEEEGATQPISVPKLSFAPNENFPDLANVLEFSRDENGKPSLVATEDIDVGQWVAIEKAYNTYVFEIHAQCNICLKLDTNLVPCKKCTTAMFCYDKCQHNVLHQYECGSKLCGDNMVNGMTMSAARTVLTAINLFPNADDLMDFVEEAINSDPNEIPDTLTDAKSKYRAFLKFPLNTPINFIESLKPFGIFKILLEIPKISMMFQTKRHQRFLMHLICYHSKISDQYLRKAELSKDMVLHITQSLIHRYFKQSCLPNVMFGFDDDILGCVAVRPIKKGELLTTSLVVLSLKDGIQQYANFDFACKCARCESVRPSTEQKERLILDPLFRSILMGSAAENREEISKVLIDKCETFLQKYGEFWCEEIGTVIDVYMGLPRSLTVQCI